MILRLLGGILTVEIVDFRHRQRPIYAEGGGNILWRRRPWAALWPLCRKAHGMTQKELAERLNVSDKTVSRWERDDGAPDLSLIPVIAEIFGVTCDELLRGQPAVPCPPGRDRRGNRSLAQGGKAAPVAAEVHPVAVQGANLSGHGRFCGRLDGGAGL